jgi:hypothetical protein
MISNSDEKGVMSASEKKRERPYLFAVRPDGALCTDELDETGRMIGISLERAPISFAG